MNVSAELDAPLVEVLLLELAEVEQDLTFDITAPAIGGRRDDDSQG